MLRGNGSPKDVLAVGLRFQDEQSDEKSFHMRKGRELRDVSMFDCSVSVVVIIIMVVMKFVANYFR